MMRKGKGFACTVHDTRSLWMMTIDDSDARALNAKYTLPPYSHMIAEPHYYSAFEILATPVHAGSRLPWLSNTSGASDECV
jgi:hypothetical protein